MDFGSTRGSHEPNERASSEQPQRGRILQANDLLYKL